MPNAAPRACTQPGCRAFTVFRSDFCEAHQTKDSGDARFRTRRPEYKKLYNKKSWEQLRIYVLNRDPICKICNREGSYIADHIKDHKGDPLLFFDRNNVQGVCKPCHDKKTGETSHSAGGNDPLAPVRTGEVGRQWVSSTNPAALDEALARDEEDWDNIQAP
jgi:5-methylcytosine-specific restriction enzyme A